MFKYLGSFNHHHMQFNRNVPVALRFVPVFVHFSFHLIIVGTDGTAPLAGPAH